MCTNLNKQKEIEQQCLDNVRREISKNACFGVSEYEYNQLEHWINEATPNIESNNFPDFLFDGGVIEHFAVTSSSENRKGSKQIAQSSRLETLGKRDFLKAIETKKHDDPISHSVHKEFETHSHANINKSIKRNWEKHVESYHKCQMKSGKCIFLLQYIDFNLQTAEFNPKGIDKVYDSYRLTVDKPMLQWIYKFKDIIEYVIFYNPKSIEIIKINKIIDLIDTLPDGIYAPLLGLERHFYSEI